MDEESEVDNEDYVQLNAAQNRKQKKAGGWQAMGLDHAVHKGVVRKGYHQPTPIQRRAIPLVCSGRDVVAMSRTGSGKTAAFVVPMLQRLKKRDTRGIRALLLSPTRELALQTFKIVKELGRFTGLFCACLIGGDNMDEQFAVLHEHPDILLATPGRLLHIVCEMNLKLSSIQYLVFDEADRLFEMGFADQLKEVIKRMPDSRQTLLFSATLPKMLIDFAKAGLSDPELVRLDVESKLSEKLSMVFAQCRQNEKLPVLLTLCRALSRRRQKSIVFCATQKHVELVVAILREAGLDPAFLYSQLDPVARKQNISRFRSEECPLLVVTDIAARGVDIPLLDVALNLHFPPKPKLFVHRVGRVARAGKRGLSISLVAPDEMAYLLDLFLFLGQPLKFVEPNSVERGERPEWDGNEDSSLIGSLPATLAHLEMEFLLNAQQNLEISDLQHKSENAMRKYERTRPQASAESVRRAKRELKALNPGTHPFFVDPDFFPEIAQDVGVAEQQILNRIRQWRPNQAIFELQNTLGSSGTFVDPNGKEQQRKWGKPAGSSSRKSEGEKRVEERAQHFVGYQPIDAHTERGLAVQQRQTETNFETAVRNVSVEMTADDEKGMYLEGKRPVWDRKRKKFVSGEKVEGGPQHVKKVRTEEGTWVPASYKSGRYDKWKKRLKTDFNDEEDEGEADEGGRKFGGTRHQKRGGSTEHGGGGGRGKRNELKNVDQIVKSRRMKHRVQEYQSHRREENLKRKTRVGRGGGRGGGGSGGTR